MMHDNVQYLYLKFRRPFFYFWVATTITVQTLKSSFLDPNPNTNPPTMAKKHQRCSYLVWCRIEKMIGDPFGHMGNI